MKNFKFDLGDLLKATTNITNLVKSVVEDFLEYWADFVRQNTPKRAQQYLFDLGFSYGWTSSGELKCDFAYGDKISSNLLTRLQAIPQITIAPSMFAGCWKIDSMLAGGGHFDLDENIYITLTEDGKATFYFGSPSSIIHISTDWTENGGTSVVISNDFGLEEIKVLLLTKDKMIVSVNIDGVKTEVSLSLC